MLLDLKMPQTSGFDVLRWVREQPSLKNLIVIVMTGSKQNEDVERAYRLGTDSFLVKPTKFSDLVTMTQALNGYCSLASNGVLNMSHVSALSLPARPGSVPPPPAEIGVVAPRALSG
jgi:CheY-like chemotaxis protein